MNMKNRKLWIMLALVSVLSALVACNLPNPNAAVDRQALGTMTSLTLTAYSAGQISPTPALTETVTLTPTVTATFSAPTLYFEGATNCRGGPGTEYDVVVVMKDGEKAEIVYRSPSGNYWVVNGPKGKGHCWVAGDFARAEGSFQTLPIATVPPVPTAKPPGGPSWKSYNYTCDFAAGGSTATVSLVWSDRATNEAGYNVYRNNELVASLGADTSAYTDVAFVGTGQSLSYYIEAYNNAAAVPGPVISVSCN
jgi:uncharacterized protein YraI